MKRLLATTLATCVALGKINVEADPGACSLSTGDCC